MNEHTGTHVDAPARRFLPPGHPHHRWVDEVPVDQWIGQACLIGCETVAPRSAVGADHVRAWEADHGRIERGDIPVFAFGWWRKWAVRPDDGGFLTDWPGLGLDCVELLLDRSIKAVGVDTLSPDVYGDTSSPVHRALLGEGVVIVEEPRAPRSRPPSLHLAHAAAQGEGRKRRAVPRHRARAGRLTIGPDRGRPSRTPTTSSRVHARRDSPAVPPQCLSLRRARPFGSRECTAAVAPHVSGSQRVSEAKPALWAS